MFLFARFALLQEEGEEEEQQVGVIMLGTLIRGGRAFTGVFSFGCFRCAGVATMNASFACGRGAMRMGAGVDRLAELE